MFLHIDSYKFKLWSYHIKRLFILSWVDRFISSNWVNKFRLNIHVFGFQYVQLLEYKYSLIGTVFLFYMFWLFCITMLCDKFNWNWPSGSREDVDNVKSLQTGRRQRQNVIRKTYLSFSSGELKMKNHFYFVKYDF